MQGLGASAIKSLCLAVRPASWVAAWVLLASAAVAATMPGEAAPPAQPAAIAAPAAEAPPAAAPAAEPSPAKIQQLLGLLTDPQVRAWIEQHGGASSPPPSGPATAAPAPATAEDANMSAAVSQQLGGIRQRLLRVFEAIPGMGEDFAHAKRKFEREFDKYGVLQMLLLVGVFIGLGLGVQWIYRRASRPAHRWLVHGAALATAGERVRVVFLRLALGIGLVASFALGSIGAFLTFDWPVLLKQVVLGYLVASLFVQLAKVVSLFLLSPPSKSRPRAEAYRIVPISDAAAAFWNRRLLLAVTWLAFGGITIELLDTFGFTQASRAVLFDALDLGLLAIGLESVWRSPKAFRDEGASPQWYWPKHPTVAALLSVYFVMLWLMWTASYKGTLAFAVVLVGLPAAIVLAQRSVNHILRPPGAERDEAALQSVPAVILERGVRALLIVGAAVFLTHAWQLDLLKLTMEDTTFTRLMRGFLNVIVIVLIADLLWHVARVLIDAKLEAAGPPGLSHSQESSRQARVRTLLPILRNGLFAVIAIITLMMALSSMGVQIGPLIASAGVVGVAVGFGSQTLVRDILSGVFYLLDDAFRVGEYIQSGTYKGVVESFSLRSVKLRHHRGPIYTVPFGSLGAVQNLSRDWNIDKITVGVAYNTDLPKVKQIIKDIGKKLLADPEIAPHIIETLKMQGVENFADYAIQIRLKMTTKPGEQFAVRRPALAMIKTAFEANGISFAHPIVHVGGTQPDQAAAAARQSLELVKPVRPAESTAA
ncbi:MAG: mechanosensitive ion channel family protein [Methylobacteriaceae bacterium]|nr:mechanosensitive ion channel family protein [Methylobacteriaceae bacterium]